jgi:hypothetical protein
MTIEQRVIRKKMMTVNYKAPKDKAAMTNLIIIQHLDRLIFKTLSTAVASTIMEGFTERTRDTVFMLSGLSSWRISASEFRMTSVIT